MPETAWLPAVALALVLTAGPATGAVAVGQHADARGEPWPTRPAPPGVDDGQLVDETALLDAHNGQLRHLGFAANGSGELSLVVQGQLVDATRDQKRAVAAGGGEYRQSSRDVGQTWFGPATRDRATWGNETLEVRRTVERGETSYERGRPTGERWLTGARLMGPYLRAGDFRVVATNWVDGQRRYVLRSVGVENRSRLERVLPRGGSDPGNFTATAVVDEAGRVHSFEASVDYTIRGERRTQRVSFALQSLGRDDVERPPWVDEGLARTGASTATAS